MRTVRVFGLTMTWPPLASSKPVAAYAYFAGACVTEPDYVP